MIMQAKRIFWACINRVIGMILVLPNWGLSFVCQAPPTYGRALNQATEDTSGEHAEAYQEYDGNPKERELLEQQNSTSVLEREPEGEQTLDEMIDSSIETLYQSENEGLDVKMKDDENEFEDEEMNDEEGEMEDEDDMKDEHQWKMIINTDLRMNMMM